MSEDEKWMMISINEANKAANENEIPVGAIIVKDNKLIAKAHNQSILKNDPTAHAEIQLLRSAGKKLQNYRLLGSTVYVTLEPCAMCLGAMVHARINRLVYGAHDPKTGVCGSCEDLSNANFFKHKISITGGVLKKNCGQLLQDFFKSRR
jgi:tRNA(adenine34) deaminase